jgi:uncharacterized BrkB/YihY/UPF0761 family membrane protein
VEAEEEADWRSCSRSKGTKSIDLGASLIAVLLLLVVVVVVVVVVAAAAVVHNSNSADVGNYTEKEENMHPDKTGNVVADVAENMSVVDVVTLLASEIVEASAALQLEIALVAVAVVVVEVHDDYYRVIPRRCMAIVKAV